MSTAPPIRQFEPIYTIDARKGIRTRAVCVLLFACANKPTLTHNKQSLWNMLKSAAPTTWPVSRGMSFDLLSAESPAQTESTSTSTTCPPSCRLTLCTSKMQVSRGALQRPTNYPDILITN